MSTIVVISIAALVGGGVWLLLARDTLRVVLGAGLLGHGIVLLLVLQGRGGAAPLAGGSEPTSDPVPQALALTAIVIGFGVAAYLLALARTEDEEQP